MDEFLEWLEGQLDWHRSAQQILQDKTARKMNGVCIDVFAQVIDRFESLLVIDAT